MTDVIETKKSAPGTNQSTRQSNDQIQRSDLKQSNLEIKSSGTLRADLLSEMTRPYGVDVHQTYLVNPDPQNLATNTSQDNKLIFVNGMKMNQESIYQAAKHLANVYGKQVYVVPNDAEKNPGYDLANCFACAIGPTTGIAAERDAINNLVDVVHHEAVLSKEKINIVAYSQGTLILNDALKIIEEKVLGEDFRHVSKVEQSERLKDWHETKQLISVHRFGAAIGISAEGIKDTLSAHRLDPVNQLGKIISTMHAARDHRQAGKSELSVRTTIGFLPEGKTSPLEIMGANHDIHQYLNNMPLFYAASLRPLSAAERADSVLESMAKGEFADNQYSKIIDEILNPSDYKGGLYDRWRGLFNTAEKEEFSRQFLSGFLQSSGTGSLVGLETSTMEKLQVAAGIKQTR